MLLSCSSCANSVALTQGGERDRTGFSEELLQNTSAQLSLPALILAHLWWVGTCGDMHLWGEWTSLSCLLHPGLSTELSGVRNWPSSLREVCRIFEINFISSQGAYSSLSGPYTLLPYPSPLCHQISGPFGYFLACWVEAWLAEEGKIQGWSVVVPRG